MIVNNFSEFYSLIKHMNLQSVSPFDNFINTVDKYKSSCACADNDGRTEKKKLAVSQYISIANGSFSQYVMKLKTPILFYNDGKLFRKY